MRRILIAGVGNIFHGDDAFGVEVIRVLSTRLLPDEVAVEDFGIRSYDLAYALTDTYDAVVLVDAMARGRPPGTVSLVEPDLPTAHGGQSTGVPASSLSAPLSATSSQRTADEGADDVLGEVKAAKVESKAPQPVAMDPHAMNLVAVLRMAQSLGGVNTKLYLVGCEPAVLDCDRGELGLSQPAQASVPIAVAMIESLINRLSAEPPALRNATVESGQNSNAGCPSAVAALPKVDVAA